MSAGGTLFFWFRALLAHGAFITSHFLYGFVQNPAGASAAMVTAANVVSAVLFLGSCVMFYFFPELFLFRPSLAEKIILRRDCRPPLSQLPFYLTKVVVWLVVLLAPIFILVFTVDYVAVATTYMMIGYLFFLAANGGFLFSGYANYLDRKREKKWGLLEYY